MTKSRLEKALEIAAPCAEPPYRFAGKSFVRGDTLVWTEPVWSEAYSPRGRRKPPSGERKIKAVVVNESYGQAKQQHTFTLTVLEASGDDAPAKGEMIRRKGRNLYGNQAERYVWRDEEAREAVAEEKHERGIRARRDRDFRREGNEMSM